MIGTECWKTYKLGDCVNLLSGGTPSKKNPEYWDGSIPWVSCKDMKKAYLYDSQDHITEKGAANGTRFVSPETILIVVRGMILGQHFPVAIAKRKMAFNQDLKALQCAPNVDPKFLFHWLRGKSYEILGIVDEAAHGTKRLQTDRLQNFPLHLPPLPIQRKIAAILSAYDDLIENNTRRIEILEEMARSIYREWFVKFRFPGHEQVQMVDSELGLTPQGWLCKFSDYVDFKEGPGLRRWQYREEGIPFLNIRTLVNNNIDLSKVQFLDPLEVQSKYLHFLLKPYDHVVSSSGTLGRIVTIQSHHLPLMLNTSIIRMRPKSSKIEKWQLKHFLQSDYFQNQIRSYASGVAQMNYGPSHLQQMWIVAPINDIGQRYEELVTPIEELIFGLVKKNDNLRQTRDLLLPRLISGEIDVENLDINTGEIAA